MRRVTGIEGYRLDYDKKFANRSLELGGHGRDTWVGQVQIQKRDLRRGR